MNKKKWNLKRVLYTTIKVIDILLLVITIAVSVIMGLYMIFEWKYPRFSNIPAAICCITFALIPAIIMTIWLIALKFLKKSYICGAGFVGIFIAIILFLPTLIVCILAPIESFTTDIKNYRKIDTYVVYDNAFYNELFPRMPVTRIIENGEFVYYDTDYYYRCRADFEFTVDIYAEWKLGEDSFNEELARVKELYRMYEGYDGSDSYYKYTEIDKGDYTCLIRYYGADPFSEADNDYSYFVFAYDESNKRVRYIVCYSQENGVNQPYYLELEW